MRNFYQKVSGVLAKPSGILLPTGQTISYHSTNGILDDDGGYKNGNPMTNRFTDNGDGTISDAVSGLMWEQKDAIPGSIHYMADRYKARRI